MFDLISIGDATIDTFIPLTDAEVEKDDGDLKLVLRYGDKIPTGSPVSMVAGNAVNSAIGASRFGLKSAIYVNIGHDSDGEDIKNKLKEENVDTRYVIKNKEYSTNRNVVLDFKGERTILVYHQPWQYSLPDLDRARWVYYTSLSSTFTQSSIVDQVVNYLERTGAKMLYNPGTFQIKVGVKKYPRLLSLTEVFACNLEEAKLTLGYEESDSISPKRLLKGLLDLGPKMVIITDGERGSYGSDGKSFYHLDVFPAKVVEKTGSGDAYAIGVLVAFFNGKDLAEAMRWGAANGAAVTEKLGSTEGLLTSDQMRLRLKENSIIVIKELK